MMRKIFAILLILALLLPCSVAFAEAEADRDSSLISIAQELTEQMTALCGSSAFRSLYGLGTDSYMNLLQSWSGDWADHANCRRAAIAFVDRDTVLSLYASVMDVVQTIPDIPDLRELEDLGDLVVSRLAPSVSYIIIGSANDPAWSVASSAAAVSEVRVLDGIEPGYAYVLLDYFGADHPLSLAAFRIQEDGAVVSNVCFVPKSELTDMAFRAADGSLELRRLASDMLAELPPQLARNVLAALDEIQIADVYF